MKFDRVYNKQHGGSAVEFAIILPLLLLFVFGVIEWGVYLFDDHIVTNASRAGARHGIVSASPRVPDSEIRSTILSYTASNLVTFGTPAPPDIPPIAICTVSGDQLAVTVNYTYNFLVLPSLTAGLVPSSKTITATTVMRCE